MSGDNKINQMNKIQHIYNGQNVTKDELFALLMRYIRNNNLKFYMWEDSARMLKNEEFYTMISCVRYLNDINDFAPFLQHYSTDIAEIHLSQLKKILLNNNIHWTQYVHWIEKRRLGNAHYNIVNILTYYPTMAFHHTMIDNSNYNDSYGVVETIKREWDKYIRNYDNCT